jgi:hypothetical protein
MLIILNYLKQKFIISNFNNYIDIIIQNIKNNNDKLNDLFIKCHKVYKQIPPVKNENKFIFGILIQLSIIDYLNNIFMKCYDLDNTHTHGSEYKNDCRLFLTNYIHFDISIKAKSKKHGNIILINNYGKNKNHNLNNYITIILVIETNTLYIIPHNIVKNDYIIYNDANICYKGSLLTYIDKNNQYLRIKLVENDMFKYFMINEYNNITSKNIYKDLYLTI